MHFLNELDALLAPSIPPNFSSLILAIPHYFLTTLSSLPIILANLSSSVAGLAWVSKPLY